MSPDPNRKLSRRKVLGESARIAGVLAGAAFLGRSLMAKPVPATVWQIDPELCVQCGKCATACVLNPSAVKCINIQSLCGFCEVCPGFLELNNNAVNSAAENQLCPANAIKRRQIEGVYYEYLIDNDACIGCARCVQGCEMFGNGSLHLQIDRGLCVDCNRCSIAAACPAQAISRVRRDQPYKLKNKKRTG